MSLPLLPLPIKCGEGGKRSRSLDRPCIPELRYEEGETINLDTRKRIIGRSSGFSKTLHDSMPPFGPDVATLQQLRNVAAAYDTPNSWDTVLRELYSQKPPLKHHPEWLDDDENLAYKTRFDNDLNPQYYLFVTHGVSTVSHIMLKGIFFARYEGGEIIEVGDPRVGETVYTSGFVWTNADPRWAWKTKEVKKKNRVIRCTIEIPTGTQVVFDRSPVMAEECEMENEKISLYPDVLLPAGQFRITAITRYMTKSGRTDTPEEEEKDVVYLKEQRSYVEPTVNDYEYAGNRLVDAEEFVDMRLMLEKSVVFPPHGSIVY